MRIHCPSCHAAYEVPDQLLADGKPVRCALCSEQWVPGPTAPDGPATEAEMPAPAALPLPATEPPAPGGRVEPRLPGYRLRNVDSVDDERPPAEDYESLAASRRGAKLAWLLSLVLLVALGWAGIVYRDTVMAAWPPSTRLYDVLGLH
jgi:predicted Zn finger-like uncharacterized protein